MHQKRTQDIPSMERKLSDDGLMGNISPRPYKELPIHEAVGLIRLFNIIDNLLLLFFLIIIILFTITITSGISSHHRPPALHHSSHFRTIFQITL